MKVVPRSQCQATESTHSACPVACAATGLLQVNMEFVVPKLVPSPPPSHGLATSKLSNPRSWNFCFFLLSSRVQGQGAVPPEQPRELQCGPEGALPRRPSPGHRALAVGDDIDEKSKSLKL